MAVMIFHSNIKLLKLRLIKSYFLFSFLYIHNIKVSTIFAYYPENYNQLLSVRILHILNTCIWNTLENRILGAKETVFLVEKANSTVDFLLGQNVSTNNELQTTNNEIHSLC